MNEQLKVGDVLEAVNPTALARRVLVTEVAANYFKAAVVEGENTKDPITVFKAGWPLYAQTANVPDERPERITPAAHSNPKI
jgi:hypothetical protein